MNDNITVLADEALGGVLREYREVKRKARVGERIKVVDAWESYGMYENGDIFVIDLVDSGGIYVNEIKTPGNDDGYLTEDEYVVLEPLDVVHIDNERLRMVDRKAAVGERVIVMEANPFFKIGDTFVVEVTGWAIPAAGLRNGNNAIDGKYRVLEPLASAPTAPAPTEIPERAIEDIASLVRKSAELERRVAELEREVGRMNTDLRVACEDLVLIEEGVSEDIRKLEREVSALKPSKYVPRVSGKVSEGPPSFAKKTPLSRDEVIELAKADVADLKKFAGTRVPRTVNNSKRGCFWPHAEGTLGYIPIDSVRYEINRKKRTVVALIHGSDPNKVWARGIARCAPGDVFNVHIGRAIALRRALGLGVPTEYLRAPKPAEVRPGDVVDTFTPGGAFHMRVFVRRVDVSPSGRIRMYHDKYRSGYTGFDPQLGDRIIDDSRDGTEVSAYE